MEQKHLCVEYTRHGHEQKIRDEHEVTFTVFPLPSGCGAIKSVMKEQGPSQRLWGTTRAWLTWGNCCFLRTAVFRANLVTPCSSCFTRGGARGKRVAGIPNREGICVCGLYRHRRGVQLSILCLSFQLCDVTCAHTSQIETRHCQPLCSLPVPLGGWGGILQSRQNWKTLGRRFLPPPHFSGWCWDKRGPFTSVNRLGPPWPSFRPLAKSLRLGGLLVACVLPVTDKGLNTVGAVAEFLPYKNRGNFSRPHRQAPVRCQPPKQSSPGVLSPCDQVLPCSVSCLASPRAVLWLASSWALELWQRLSGCWWGRHLRFLLQISPGRNHVQVESCQLF